MAGGRQKHATCKAVNVVRIDSVSSKAHAELAPA